MNDQAALVQRNRNVNLGAIAKSGIWFGQGIKNRINFFTERRPCRHDILAHTTIASSASHHSTRSRRGLLCGFDTICIKDDPPDFCAARTAIGSGFQ